MSAAVASEYVRTMIHRESTGPGDCERAMQKIEAKYGIGYWTLDYLRKRKAKTIDVSLFARVNPNTRRVGPMPDMTETPITTEEFREYHYADGVKYRIDAPVRLWRKKDADGDSHRVLDAAGITHYPKRGWVAISWKAPGEPVSF